MLDFTERSELRYARRIKIQLDLHDGNFLKEIAVFTRQQRIYLKFTSPIIIQITVRRKNNLGSLAFYF